VSRVGLNWLKIGSDYDFCISLVLNILTATGYLTVTFYFRLSHRNVAIRLDSPKQLINALS
jgi:hypothetical protein